MIANPPAAVAVFGGTTVARLLHPRAWLRDRRVTVLAVSVLALASGIAGCGGGGSSGNGVAAKSPDAIITAATNAARGAKSVHIAGSIASGGSSVVFDLNLATGQGGEGQISQTGLGSFRMIVLRRDVYITGNANFLRHFGGVGAVQLFHGRWLRGPATGQLAGVARLADAPKLFSAFLAGHGKLAKGGTSTVAGEKVIAVNDTSLGGTLYVATTGKPFPIEITKSGSGGGRVTFDRYNQSVSLSAPANSIDMTKLAGAQG